MRAPNARGFRVERLAGRRAGHGVRTAGPDDIERYYTDIRGGRRPSPEHLEELKERYAAIGNVFPLLETTRRQADGIVERLNAGPGIERVPRLPRDEALGTVHPDAIASMRRRSGAG
jgi:protoheme ferro-lyase